MFGKKTTNDKSEAQPNESADPSQEGEKAIDTLGGMLRSMAEFALEQETTDIDTFRKLAEAWAQHVAVAAPAPGIPVEEAIKRGGRRDWQGVRQFVREYCRSSSKQTTSVATDLRDVIWVFIRNFSQAFALDEETDGRVQAQVARLEKLVEASAAAELKREVVDAVGTITQALEERHHRQRVQMSNLGETVRALGYELESARRESETDPLTGVFNRKAFDAYLERTVEMYKAFQHDMCLMVLDVDHFKAINDSHGHITGDRALREVADAMGRVFLRKSDFVARFGGDEFAVVLRETPIKDSMSLAERILSRIRAVKLKVGDEELALTVSMGVARLERGDDAKSWFERADRGLFAAKSEGRNRLSVGVAQATP